MKSLRVAAMLTIACALASTAAEAQSRRRGNQDQQAPGGVQTIIQQEKRFPLGAQWVAVSLNGKPYTGIERPVFLLNDQFRATGFGGCNSFSATAFPLKDQGLAVGPLALTKRSCDKAAMEMERAYFIALRTAAKWQTAQGALILTSPSGELRFERSL